jgi:KipI family sensor histidine kinase inhibitor
MVETLGGKINHVKPHGAMYNAAAKDFEMAMVIAQAVKEIDSSLILFGLSGSEMIKAAGDIGLAFASEVFADRAYNDDGSLVSRNLPGAVLHNTVQVVDRAVKMITEKAVVTISGITIPIRADTICIHGDNDMALEFAKSLVSVFRFQYIPSGDSAVIIKAGDEISEEINLTVRKLLARIENENIIGVIDFIPSYNELMICYDLSIISCRKLLDTLRTLESDIDAIHLPESSVIHIPVLYGGESGPDLKEVAALNKLSEEEVVKIHSSSSYKVYMLGFTPGFCYLGGMDQRIATHRKQSPRLIIPAGAVGIAEKQTGIYPIESPGGWQLIGKTPLRLFDPGNKPEFLIQAGDYIKFYPITEYEFTDILKEVNKGVYRVNKSKYS